MSLRPLRRLTSAPATWMPAVLLLATIGFAPHADADTDPAAPAQAAGQDTATATESATVPATATDAAGKEGTPSQDAKPATSPAAISAEQVESWVAQLSSDSFTERKAATQKLIDAGAAAVTPVAAAALSDDLELPTRCINILKKIYTSDDENAKKTAETALQKLAASESPFLARRAKEAMKNPAPIQPARANRFGGRVQIQVVGGGIRIGGGAGGLQRKVEVKDGDRKVQITETIGRQIVVRVTETKNGKETTTEYKAANAVALLKKHPEAHKLYVKHIRGAAARPQIVVGNRAVVRGAGNNIQVQMKNVNGNREIQVVENGRKVEISDTGGKNIKVRITETVNGKETTRTVEADDVDALKKKDAKAAELYEQYGGGNNGIKVLGGGAKIQIQGIQAIPGRVLPNRIQPAAPKDR